MSPRRRPIGTSAVLFSLVICASVIAQSQWKEIPVGYNMPKSVMAAAPPSATPFPKPPKGDMPYSGEGRDAKHRWEVEFHGGGFFTLGSAPPGQAYLPPTGTPFLTVNGTPSLFVPSYMFGDGTTLVNQVAGTGFVPGAGPITPLDPLLGQALG